MGFMFTVTDYRLGSRASILRLRSSHYEADLIEIVNYIINCQCYVCSNKCELENLFVSGNYEGSKEN